VIIIHSAHSAHEVVVLQPDTGIGFAITLDDITWHSKTHGEMHGASKCLQVGPFRTESVSLGLSLDHHGPHNADFTCVIGTMRRRPLGGAVDVPTVLIERLFVSTGHRLKFSPVRTPLSSSEPLGRPFVCHPRDA
jgi:hypothetical protein